MPDTIGWVRTSVGWEASGDGWSVEIVEQTTGQCILNVSYPEPRLRDGFAGWSSVEKNRVTATRAARAFLIEKGLVAS